LTSIDPNVRPLAYLREQAQALRQPSSGTTQQTDSSWDRSCGAGESPAQVLARRLAAIDRDDPKARRKVFRLYLESVLLQELGASLALDSGFAAMVDRVHDTMERDEGLKEAMDQAGALLLKA
jgi:hypothetical protein